MAQYEIKFACGHSEARALFGPNSERERKIAWFETLPCQSCVQIERVKAAVGISELDAAAGYPKLAGSEKQVAWATQIRHDAILGARKLEHRLKDSALTDEKGGALAEQLLFELDDFTAGWKSQPSAQWWIDSRDDVSEAAVRSHLGKIQHDIADQYQVTVAEIGISSADQREIMKMALNQKAEELEMRREAAKREKIHAAQVQSEQKRTAVENDWKSRDEVAKAVFEALGTWCRVTVWMPKTEKRVYLDRGDAKACLYVTGNNYNRPGKLEIVSGFKDIDKEKVKAALELAAKKYITLKLGVSEEGKAE